MNSLLIKYIINKGIILKSSTRFPTDGDIKRLYKRLEPIINSVMYSKGRFITEGTQKLYNAPLVMVYRFKNRDIIPLHLLKDVILDNPKLNVEYDIMYYINEKQQVILLGYETTKI